MTSDVFCCVRVTLILIKVILQNAEKSKLCKKVFLKRIKDIFQNNDKCTELTSDEQMSLVHSETHLTSLAKFSSSPFQDSFYSN